jgi:ribonuclease HI
VLKATETLHITENGSYTAAIFMDSRNTIHPLKVNNHSLIEDVMKKISILETANWKIEFSCVKAHVETYGNEPADQLTKAAV